MLKFDGLTRAWMRKLRLQLCLIIVVVILCQCGTRTEAQRRSVRRTAKLSHSLKQAQSQRGNDDVAGSGKQLEINQKEIADENAISWPVQLARWRDVSDKIDNVLTRFADMKSKADSLQLEQKSSEGESNSASSVSDSLQSRYFGATFGPERLERHGFGRQVFGTTLGCAETDFYEGEWLYDVQHGLGRAVTPHVSELEVRNRAPKRASRVRDASSQAGLVAEDSALVMADAGTDEYIGEWEFGLHHGVGRLIAATGDRYDGEWRVGGEEGVGRLQWSNGDVYIGHFLRGQPHGFGRLISSGGSTYDGEFAEGKRHGAAVIHRQGRVVFRGQFENDRPDRVPAT